MGFSTCVLVNQPVYLFAVFPTYAHDFPNGADIAMINGVQHHFPKLIEESSLSAHVCRSLYVEG